MANSVRIEITKQLYAQNVYLIEQNAKLQTIVENLEQQLTQIHAQINDGHVENICRRLLEKEKNVVTDLIEDGQRIVRELRDAGRYGE